MNTPRETMNERDLKTLRIDYLRNIFPSASLTLVLILIIVLYHGINKNSGQLSLLLVLFAFIVGSVVFIFLTRNHRLDMNLRKVSIERAIVEDKEYKLDYEAGSATLPVNLLSFIFIKKISQREMKELHIHSVVVNGEKFYLDKISFDKTEIGGDIIIRRAENTKLFLGVDAL